MPDRSARPRHARRGRRRSGKSEQRTRCWTDDEDEFVEQLVAGLGTFPSYFAELPERNRRGPHLYRELPVLARLDVDTVSRHLADQGRSHAHPITAFAVEHAVGAISIAARQVFANWLGWLVDLDRPVILMLDDDTDRADLVRQCLRIGHDAIVGEVAGGIDVAPPGCRHRRSRWSPPTLSTAR